jgi:hypothetical protein
MLSRVHTPSSPVRERERERDKVREGERKIYIYVGILCFESEVFNFLFSNFSFKID